MIYLDYSATTPPSDRALAAFAAASRDVFGNANSTHAFGRAAEEAMRSASATVLGALGAVDCETVFTSGATEANNLAIKGYALHHRAEGNHLILSPFEHSSVTACFGYLAKHGFEVDVVETDADGRVTPELLERALRPDTILVSVAAVASELGIVQPIAELSALVAARSRAAFHSDITQAVGKIPVPFAGIAMASLSAHKFYGLKGVGALIKRRDVLLEPQIHGGASTTPYRSGTPAAPLAVSLADSLAEAVALQPEHAHRVAFLAQRLVASLASIPGVLVNSPTGSIPHILNLSVLSREAADMVRFLDERGIAVSKQTACSSRSSRSEAVLRLTGDERRATTSIRISLSHLTLESELDALIACVREVAER
ncbi:MAG: cysteine desulfurase family protein [Candidatus Izemoplasmatales bacterium]